MVQSLSKSASTILELEPTIDESEQLYPEQSTTAFAIYHPAAKYFSA